MTVLKKLKLKMKTNDKAAYRADVFVFFTILVILARTFDSAAEKRLARIFLKRHEALLMRCFCFAISLEVVPTSEEFMFRSVTAAGYHIDK